MHKSQHSFTRYTSPIRLNLKKHMFVAMFLFTLLFMFVIADYTFLPVVPKRRSFNSPSVLTMSRRELPRGRARRFPVPYLTNLIIVAGHSVFTGSNFDDAGRLSSWFLESYQNVSGEAESFLEHIRLGVSAAAYDPTSLLLFSGGETRKSAGPRSEGAGYWSVAEAASWFGLKDSGVRSRSFTEEHARDSFENLLFSFCRFFELTGGYPKHVTVVSYNLKRERFSSIHRATVHYPESRFSFIGSNLPAGVKGALEGEARTVAAFRKDPFGCFNPLMEKKLARDPFAVGPPHPSRCPAIEPLLTYCDKPQAAAATKTRTGRQGRDNEELERAYMGKVPWV